MCNIWGRKGSTNGEIWVLCILTSFYSSIGVLGVKEGGLVRQSINISALALRYIVMGNGVQSCHFVLNLAVPPRMPKNQIAIVFEFTEKQFLTAGSNLRIMYII